MSFPEHDKLQKISRQSQTIGEFVDWLGERGTFLAWRDPTWHNNSGCLLRIQTSLQDLLAEFFNIDTNALEAEKRRMLENQRRMNRRIDEATR